MVTQILSQFNWVDAVFIGIIGYFLLTNRGLVATIIEILGFIFSLLFSYRIYAYIGSLMVLYFKLPRGIAQAAAFFIAWFSSEILFYVATTLLIPPFLRRVRDHPLNIIFGFPVAVIQGALMFLLFVSLVFAFPVRGQIKQDILNSTTGPAFVNIGQQFELQIKGVFSEAISESVNFLTVKPRSDEVVQLDFKVKNTELSVDAVSEEKMIELVNSERVKRGIHPLQKDEQLMQLGRAYAKEMFEHGFFSHVSQVDGSTPGDRANRMNIEYMVLGENLAYAPDVYLAHQGLMNSEGHRKNILSEDFGRVGIGVIDGGVYGKMFVQEFAN